MNTPQVDKTHYRRAYDTKGRFSSFWHQVDEALALQKSEYLEIGVGSGFLSDYLRKNGLRIKTVDIDPELKPDYVGSVLDLPMDDGSFDVVMCFQVLEHLPFTNFLTALKELGRVSREYVILSLPDRSPHLYVQLRLYPFFEKWFCLTIPNPLSKKHKYDGEHYWEIGKRDTPLSVVTKSINVAGFRTLKHYRVNEKPLHRFFVLKKLHAR